MVIDTMVESERSGDRHYAHSTRVPDWVEIETAISRLDGESRSLVTLDTPDSCHMAIGGGGDGRYTVQATFDWGEFMALVHPERKGSEELRMGGVSRVCPARAIVNRNEALKAARAFAILGALDASCAWESL